MLCCADDVSLTCILSSTPLFNYLNCLWISFMCLHVCVGGGKELPCGRNTVQFEYGTFFLMTSHRPFRCNRESWRMQKRDWMGKGGKYGKSLNSIKDMRVLWIINNDKCVLFISQCERDSPVFENNSRNQKFSLFPAFLREKPHHNWKWKYTMNWLWTWPRGLVLTLEDVKRNEICTSFAATVFWKPCGSLTLSKRSCKWMYGC